uniref:DNTTIP1 dimerisation domain-containing protein n=1 Tax=Panagrolaimus superbus TaxID=310955 RepID=A0A914YI37_9BILA
MERTPNYSINFFRFVLDPESREITNQNIGNVIILIIHNKLKINYNAKNKAIDLTLNSQINPIPLSNLRIDNLPFCKLYNALTDDIYRDLKKQFQNCRSYISSAIANPVFFVAMGVSVVEDELLTGNGNGNKMNMKIDILENLLKSVGYGSSAKVNSLRQALRRNKADIADDAYRSLDLLRMVFQAEMTAEIRQIIDRHVRTTFAPAFENLRRNGQIVGPKEIADLSMGILDGVKESYMPPKEYPACLPAEDVLKPLPVTELGPPPLPALPDSRRYESDDNESDCSAISSQLSQHQYRGQYNHEYNGSRPKKRGRPRKVDVDSGRSGTPIMNGSENVTFADAMKWNPDRLTNTTRFILGSKVNKLLAMGHRGHIFVKYPRIFRYVGDDEDKAWLFDRNISTRMSGKVFFMLLQDVIELAQKENAPPHIQGDLARHAFLVHEKIIAKMKIAMRPLFEQLQSRIFYENDNTVSFNAFLMQ